MNIGDKVANEYTKSLNLHISYVQEAGAKLGVNQKQLLIHDLSKWQPEEFYGYALHFHGGGAPDKFASAWLHHIHYNPHHWQHWIFPNDFTPKNSSVVNGIVEMPKAFALEMIADWMGTERTYGGTWDMSNWLTSNLCKIRVHPNTADYLYEVLNGLGYTDVIYKVKFKTA